MLKLLIFLILFEFSYGLNNEIRLETNLGSNVILPCISNDKNHSFMFWHFMETGQIISPLNEFNPNKYQYEVLTGNLTIKKISLEDAGLYNCVSDGIVNHHILAQTVRLKIKNIPDESSHNNQSENLWKTSAVLGIILLMLVIIAVGLHVYHKPEVKQNYFDIIEEDDDDDSAEELFTREPSTSTGIKGKSKLLKKDNFQKVFTTINNQI